LAVIVILLVLFVVSQNPKVISATVSPEVIVKGQNQEVTVTAVVKPRGFISVKIKVTMAERGYDGEPKTQKDYLKFYSVFKRNPQTLGYLQLTGNDNQGNSVYIGKFNIQKDQPQTAQIKLTNLGLTLTTLRLAVSTRSLTLPPDPGEVGKQTLEGIDSDKDGIRDDVQREIMFLAPESEKLRMALGQIAKPNQELVSRNDLNKEQSSDLMGKSMDGLVCIGAMYKLTDSIIYRNYVIETRLESIVANTSTRKKLKKNNYIIAGGQFTGFTDIKRCSFNPSDYSD
jgi:hypothetical protein